MGAVQAIVRFPAEGMGAVQFGFQVHHGTGPVKTFEQAFELGDPEFPLVFDGLVTRAEVDDLGLVQAATRPLAAGKHLAPEERPGIANRQGFEHLLVEQAPQAALRWAVRWPVTNAAIDDGFRFHGVTPQKTGCLLSYRVIQGNSEAP